MRILIATVSAGSGHVQAARALEEAWSALHPDDELRVVDVIESTPWLYKKAYIEGYMELVDRAPDLYALAFRKTDNPKLVRRMARIRNVFVRTIARRFVRDLRAWKPHVILCPHFLPLEILSALPKQRRKPFVAGIVTDFEAHALWVENATDLLCVAAEETKARLVARGVPREQICITGIPVLQAFQERLPRAALRKRLHLRPKIPVVLLMGGGFGHGPMLEVLPALDALRRPVQILAVTGSNEELFAKIQETTWRQPVRALGFVDNVHELIRAADLIVTKPGGLTSSEALALGTPLIVLDPIPGQEAANSDYLLEHGAAVKANRTEDVAYLVDLLLGSARLRSLQRAANRLGKPDAAADVCRAVMERMKG